MLRRVEAQIVSRYADKQGGRHIPRFSIRWLMVAVLLIAVTIVALLNANYYWVYALENFAILLLLSALAGSFWLISSRRAFCGGFLIFGLFYFATGTDFFGVSRAFRLLPTTGLNFLHEKMFEPKSDVIPVGGSAGDADVKTSNRLPDGSRSVVIVRPGRQVFVNAGNAIFCILFGLVGAVLARWMYDSRLMNGKEEHKANADGLATGFADRQGPRSA
jgi:hypothetical protein